MRYSEARLGTRARCATAVVQELTVKPALHCARDRRWEPLTRSNRLPASTPAQFGDRLESERCAIRKYYYRPFVSLWCVWLYRTCMRLQMPHPL